jgi:hypothetical protein
MWAIREGIIKVPYQRTGTYGSAWNIVKTDASRGNSEGYALVGEAVNKETGLEYTKYVSGSAYGTAQARIHQGRWPLLRDVIEEAMKELPKEISNDVVMVARRRWYKAE